MYKLGFKEAEKPEMKLPAFVGSWGKQGSCRKTPTFASLTMAKPLTVWITANWKILQEMGISYQLTCLLRNLHAGQEATVITRHRKMDWFQIGKGVCQGYILSPCLLNLDAEYIMRKAELILLESRLPGEISITSDMQMTPPLWLKVKRNYRVS